MEGQVFMSPEQKVEALWQLMEEELTRKAKERPTRYDKGWDEGRAALATQAMTILGKPAAGQW